MTLLEALEDPKLLGQVLRGTTWGAWLAALRALFGLPLSAEAYALYQACTGRVQVPEEPVREGWFVVGRRGGKSRIMALVAIFLAFFKRYDDVLAPGEVGTIALIAADRRQCRTLLRYITGTVDAVPMLRKMVVNTTKESIELKNRVVIEVFTASSATVRGYTLIAAICDELSFWRAEDSADPDVDVLNGLRPAMATIPGALMLCISSPYSRRGALWSAYQKHFGKNGDPVMVWQADTRTMNPTVSERVVAEAYEDDPAAASAEFGARFRSDLESYVSREVVDRATVTDRTELPPMRDVSYVAFCDPAGGSGGDSMTLAIAHFDTERACVVLDCLRERRPPFSPDDATRELAETLKAYSLATVEGDKYAGAWPEERFRAHGIHYSASARPKSEIYLSALPLLNAGQVELLDIPKLKAQLCGLERKTARGGRDSVDHAPRQHDDVVNAAAGAILRAYGQQGLCVDLSINGFFWKRSEWRTYQ